MNLYFLTKKEKVLKWKKLLKSINLPIFFFFSKKGQFLKIVYLKAIQTNIQYIIYITIKYYNKFYFEQNAS